MTGALHPGLSHHAFSLQDLGDAASGRQRHIDVFTLNGHGEGCHWRRRGEVNTPSFTQIKTPAMPKTRNDAFMHSAVIQWRTSVWTLIFNGIEVPLRAKNGDIAFAHFELAAGAFRNTCSTGETDRTCCRGLHRVSALLYVK